jgi:MoaA/NifB/PqqE/SkfB family radical SAM enzyme
MKTKVFPFGIVGVTYRCNAKCYMCNIWKNPTKQEDEIKPEHLNSIPYMKSTNITGGEPFIRVDIEQIIEKVYPKTKRLVISTNGYFTDRILKVAKRFPKIGIRVSLEGLPSANDDLRGIKDGFDHGLRTILSLQAMGFKDIGFGITISDRNVDDLIELYELAKSMNVEFASAAIHNAFYFHKMDNKFEKPEYVAKRFEELTKKLLKTNRPKNWFRAYFNYNLANYVRGNARPLPCSAGEDFFFIDPRGEIFVCNALQESIGNIKEHDFWTIWNSKRGEEVREMAHKCNKECWMIGSASPAIKKNKLKVAKWILKNKLSG